MSFLASTLKKDLARWRQDFASVLIWLSIPLLIGGLITALMDGGGGAKPRGILLIADQDESFISGFVAGAYSQGELGELISVEKVTVEDGAARINAGEASGFLVIPEGFGDAMLQSEPVTLNLKTNPAQTILPGIITNVTEVLLDAGFYIHQLFGDEIAAIKDSIDDDVTPDDVFIAATSVTIQNKIESVAPHLFPPSIDIQVVEPPAEEPDVPFALLYLPGIILMSVMFSANGLAGDYWAERQQGTLRRLVIAPGQLTGFVAGKALAAGIVIAIIGGVTLVIGFLYHGVPWSRFPTSLVWIAVSGIALFAWFAALQMLASSQRTASVLSSAFLFPFLMAGGSFFPFAALPDWIAAIGRLTPNGFMADRLTTAITAGAARAIDGESWLTVAAIAVTGLVVSAWRLQAGFARG